MIGIKGINGFVAELETNVYVSESTQFTGSGSQVQFINVDSYGIIWAMRYSGILAYSTNNGITFQNLGVNPLLSGHFAVCFDNLGRVITINHETGFLYVGEITRDFNNTPTAVSWETPIDLGAIQIFYDLCQGIDGALYISGRNGHIYKSSDYITVTDLGKFTDEWNKQIKTDSDGNIYFITDSNNLYKSTDNGLTFNKIFYFGESIKKRINAITIDNNDTIYIQECSYHLFNEPTKLYVSTTKGESFDNGTITNPYSISQDFFGAVAYDIGRLCITLRDGYAFQATYTAEMKLEIIDKTLDNAEIVCVMNKGNDAFLPNFGFTPTRFAETQTSTSVLRKSLTKELEKDNFTDISISQDETGDIILDCKNEQ